MSMRKYVVNNQFAETLKLLNTEFEDLLSTWRCPKYLNRLNSYLQTHQS